MNVTQSTITHIVSKFHLCTFGDAQEGCEIWETLSCLLILEADS